MYPFNLNQTIFNTLKSKNSHLIKSISTSLINFESNLSLLRKRTGLTFTLCKRALNENNNDLDKAESWLKEEVKTGLEKSQKITNFFQFFKVITHLGEKIQIKKACFIKNQYDDKSISLAGYGHSTEGLDNFINDGTFGKLNRPVSLLEQEFLHSTKLEPVNRIFNLSILNKDYFKELLNKSSPEYYFKKYGINPSTNINVYKSTLHKNYEIFCAILIFVFPIFLYTLYKVYDRMKNEEYLDTVFESSLPADEEDKKIYLLSFVGVILIFLLQISILMYHLRSTPLSIYFNSNTKKFTLIFKSLPILNIIKKQSINCGQAKLTESKNLLIFKLFKINTKLSNGKLIYIDKDSFIKPLYGNLFYGYTKDTHLK